MTWDTGTVARAVAVILLGISLIELAGGDFASGAGLLIFFVVLSVVPKRLKAGDDRRPFI